MADYFAYTVARAIPLIKLALLEWWLPFLLAFEDLIGTTVA